MNDFRLPTDRINFATSQIQCQNVISKNDCGGSSSVAPKKQFIRLFMQSNHCGLAISMLASISVSFPSSSHIAFITATRSVFAINCQKRYIAQCTLCAGIHSNLRTRERNIHHQWGTHRGSRHPSIPHSRFIGTATGIFATLSKNQFCGLDLWKRTHSTDFFTTWPMSVWHVFQTYRLRRPCFAYFESSFFLRRSTIFHRNQRIFPTNRTDIETRAIVFDTHTLLVISRKKYYFSGASKMAGPIWNWRHRVLI